MHADADDGRRHIAEGGTGNNGLILEFGLFLYKKNIGCDKIGAVLILLTKTLNNK